MTKKELIALTKEVRDKIEKLRAEMSSAIDSASETDNDVYNIPYEEDCECNSAFIGLCNTLDDFAQLLGERRDIVEGEVVMCRPPISLYWKPQIYVGNGVTKPTMDSPARQSDWLYIVPLKYFKPTSTDWRPAESYNWANFREEEE